MPDRAIKPDHLLRLADEVGRLVKPALACWGGAEACVDAYETAVRATTDAHLNVARLAGAEPMRSMFASFADMTRDVGAAQLSAARWILDV